MKALLEKFHEAILRKDAALATPDLKRNQRLSPERQMAIYIDGYRIRLAQAIRSDYPALLAYLGEKRFDALALEYIEKNPPAHFSLDRYPHGFAAFVQKDDFAAELARLEGAIAEVFMLEESAPLAANALTALSPEAFGALRLSPRRAAKLLAFSYPVDAWLSAERSGNVPATPAPQATYLYVYRHHNEVQRAALSEEAYLLLAEFFKGSSAAEAFDALEKTHPQHCEIIAHQLTGWFAEWLEQGFFGE